jgi:hypothetical protein
MAIRMFRGTMARVEGKKNLGFCGGRIRFFIFKVGGGGSQSCCLKDVLSHPLVRVCRKLETLWQKMKNVHNNKKKSLPKGKFFNKAIKKHFVLLHTLTYENHDLLCSPMLG